MSLHLNSLSLQYAEKTGKESLNTENNVFIMLQILNWLKKINIMDECITDVVGRGWCRLG